MQCVSEGWSDKIKEQATEGCNIAGKVRVNKVIGNLCVSLTTPCWSFPCKERADYLSIWPVRTHSHLSPGRSFQSNQKHAQELVPYLQGDAGHDFGHVINHFSFASETEDEFVGMGGRKAREVKKALGIVNPLDGIKAHTEKSN